MPFEKCLKNTLAKMQSQKRSLDIAKRQDLVDGPCRGACISDAALDYQMRISIIREKENGELAAKVERREGEGTRVAMEWIDLIVVGSGVREAVVLYRVRQKSFSQVQAEMFRGSVLAPSAEHFTMPFSEPRKNSFGELCTVGYEENEIDGGRTYREFHKRSSFLKESNFKLASPEQL